MNNNYDIIYYTPKGDLAYIQSCSDILPTHAAIFSIINQLTNNYFDSDAIKENNIKINNLQLLQEHRMNHDYSIKECVYCVQNIPCDLFVKTERNKIEGYVYIIKQGEYYKIGKTTNPTSRKKTYITENPNEVEYIDAVKCSDYSVAEVAAHDMFKDKNHRGEWFKLSQDDVENLIKFLKEKHATDIK